ncbi:MAG: hypothetical protein QG597_490 [Actinomycetota bacterium]|nr:hypothetical protein [Actinomycetota bacterium]
MSTTAWDQNDHDPTSIARGCDHSDHQLPDDFYADWHVEVDQRRIALLIALNAALRDLDHASAALAELISNQLYDIEFAEGRDGADIADFLDDSQRYLRAAYAIAHRITERR